VQSDAERALRALRVLCVAWRAHAGHLFSPVSDGVQWRASLEPLEPTEAEGLSVQVRQFLTLADVSSDMTTVLESEATQSSSVQVAGAAYELVLLTCLDGKTRRVAGVAALSAAAGPRHAEHTQVVPAVAAQLLDIKTAVLP